MPADPVKSFLQGLQKSRLLSEEQWKVVRHLARDARKKTQTIADSPEQKQKELDELTAGLRQQKLLTQWHLTQLKKGQTGFVLGQYRLLHPVGRGGMGHVFKADRFDNPDPVAVKVMARKLTSNESLVSRFQREIKASSKLQSPHVVRTLDAGRVGKVDFMVMEFVNGDQIDEIACKAQTLPVGLACEIARHAALGLQHAYEQQMVHRDIKPGNLIVNWEESGEGTVKVMDMGLVMMLGDETQHQMTRTGQVMGTPDYMSPEQGWDTTSVDIRGDIYSLGCSLFRLLTGTTPFTGTNPLQVLSQRLQRDAPAITTIDGSLPEDVSSVVCRMTTRDPDQRFQTPAEVADALAPFCERLTRSGIELATTANQDQTTTPLPETQIVDSSSELDEGDGTYQQFLKEVDRGTGVDLIELGATHSAVESSMPIVQTEPQSALDKTRQRRGKRRRPRTTSDSADAADLESANAGSGRRKAIVGGAIAAALLVAAVFAWPGDGSNQKQPADGNGESFTASTISFPDVPPQKAIAGRLLQFTPEFELESTNDSDVIFRLKDKPDIGMSIDERTAEFTWLVPRSQPLKPLSVQMEVVERRGDSQAVIGDHELVVDVRVDAASVSMSVPEPRQLRTAPDVPVTLSLAVNDRFDESLSIHYLLTEPSDTTAILDDQTGEFQWTPGRDHFGINEFQIEARNASTGDLLDQQSIAVAVIPDSIDDLMDTPEPLTAVPGQKIAHKLGPLKILNRPRAPARFYVDVDSSAPAGAKIDRRNNEFRWTVPLDATGEIVVPLRGSIRTRSGGSRKLAGTLPLTIQISEGANGPTGNVPVESELAPLMKELRNAFERRISRARTASDKASLGRSLLGDSYSKESGPEEYALLEIIEADLATPSKNLLMQLQIAERKASRYGVNELDRAAELLESFTRRSVSSADRDLVMEHFVRLMERSVEEKRLPLTATLLKATRNLTPRTGAGFFRPLTDDLKVVSEIVTAELEDSDGQNISDAKLSEVQRILAKWQFAPVFRESSATRWFQSSGTAISTAELREMWKIEDDRITLKANQAQALVGFVDGSLSTDRFIFRCQLLPGSNAAQIVAGLNPDVTPRPPGLVISVDSANPGQIRSLADGSVAAAKTTANLAAFRTNEPNELELTVNNSRIVIRLNGTVLNQATLPAAMPGLPGLGADLNIADPQVKIRAPRILTLPED